MKKMKRSLSIALVTAAISSLLVVSASAADYNFTTTAPQDYYDSSSYEDVYGSKYNYGGRNVVDYQIPELEYGVQSTTMTGVMERTILPGLQGTMATGGGAYGVSGGGGPITVLTEDSTGTSVGASSPTTASPQHYQGPAYTSAEGMERKDGSIGTVQIPSLSISMKLWEGETSSSMSKGMGHYSSTSAWNGNVGACGHNRGAKYVIGSIKDLEIGDIITYTTIYGTRTYAVSTVRKISNTDWSYLQSTTDNRITITTCVAGDSSLRWVVQAVEKK